MNLRVVTGGMLWLIVGLETSAQEPTPRPRPVEQSAQTEQTEIVEPSRATELPTAAAEAGASAAPGAQYLDKAARIRELMGATLSVAVNAESLFDIPLDDPATVALEASRLRRLLGDAGITSQSEIEHSADRADVPVTEDKGVGPEVWAARLQLDRARLAFYSLPARERAALLASHAEQQSADARSRALKESGEAAQRAQAAAAEREHVLAAAQLARTEAERLVGEERARLLGLASQLAGRQSELGRGSSELAGRSERTLGLHRRVRQVVTSPTTPPALVDALYHELRGWLRASRDELAQALLADHTEAATAQALESDPLSDLPVQVDRRVVDKLRKDVFTTVTLLANQSAEFHRKRAEQLYEDVQSLNDDRLALLPHLSSQRRAAITGFGATGLDQALAEIRQVALVLTFHARTVTEWFGSGAWRTWRGQSAGSATTVLLKALLAVGVWYWGRRVAANLLSNWRQRRRENARNMRSVQVDRMDSAVRVLLRVLPPLGWLLLVSAIIWILPRAASRLMEVQLFVTVLQWTLGGWLAVATLDSLAMRRAARIHARRGPSTDALRLRSLRLIGAAVVITGLILSVTRRIVGAGTVYSWVIGTCGWVAVPIGIVIVRWWREAIFDRIERARRKSAFENWVLTQRSGWHGLIAAALAGAYLFSRGAISILRAWLGSFEITRRFLAYVFRQQLDRMAERRDVSPLAPLSVEIFEALSPSVLSSEIVACADNAKVEEIIKHLDRASGGVYAVVGERGSGRSMVLRGVSRARERVALVDCPFDGLEALTAALAKAMNSGEGGDLERLAARLDAEPEDLGIIIDNAHRLIHPVMGGLMAFDQLIDCARRHSSRCAWVISVDRIVWRFYSRARTANTLFDQIVVLEDWSEEDIAALLKSRSREAGVIPAFDRLLPGLSPDAAGEDDEEASEVRASVALSYYRLIWDYAAGNPGVALHMWRTSLGIASDGSVHVTPFRVPDSGVFDTLPDVAIFSLRAVLQLERACAADVARATMAPLAEVESSLRFGLKTGYLERTGERYAVTWNWYRPITRLLQRRHLLAAG